MRTIRIGARQLGVGSPYLIAEAGVNHNGDAAVAHRLVALAAEAGADAVKFQLFDAASLARSDAPSARYQQSSGASQRAMLTRLELDPAVFRDLAETAGDLGIEFLCTPFSLDAARFLIEDLDVAALKISSGDLTYTPLLRFVSGADRPILLSTGMADMDEIKRALDDLSGADVVLLHCVSQYPAPEEMAGGEGQRLRPLTEQIPKPMVRVAGRPVLERLVPHLVGWGIRRIFLSINYLGEIIEDHFGDGSRFGCSIEYLREDEPLGSGGSLALLPEPPPDPLLVMNGDLITQVNVRRLLERHETRSNLATIGLHSHSLEMPYGVVKTVDADVVELVEKPTESYLVNAGIYVLSRALVARVPDGKLFPITKLFDDALSRNETIGWYLIEEDWIDVGSHRDLDEARGRT